MNIWRGTKIPERLQTPEYLEQATWQFANSLAANRWGQQQISRVAVMRTIVEGIGQEAYLGEEEVGPIYNEITIAFSALKLYTETSEGGLFVPNYNIKSSTTQDIDKTEIPKHVFDEIFEDAKKEEHSFHDLIDDEAQTIDWVADNLDDLELTRTQEVEYVIDHEGHLEDYLVSYSYSFDDEIMHEVDYRRSDSSLFWTPISLADGTSREKKPIIVPFLTDTALRREVANVDTAFKEFLLDQSLVELTDFAAQSEQEHIRRVLGILTMLSGNTRV